MCQHEPEDDQDDCEGEEAPGEAPGAGRPSGVRLLAAPPGLASSGEIHLPLDSLLSMRPVM